MEKQCILTGEAGFEEAAVTVGEKPATGILNSFARGFSLKVLLYVDAHNVHSNNYYMTTCIYV